MYPNVHLNICQVAKSPDFEKHVSQFLRNFCIMQSEILVTQFSKVKHHSQSSKMSTKNGCKNVTVKFAADCSEQIQILKKIVFIS